MAKTQLEKDIRRIVDVFSAADGGVSLVAFRRFVANMESENTETSRQIIDVVHRFSRLLAASTPIDGL